jgi:membrane-bound lytic murein transglycosylase B
MGICIHARQGFRLILGLASSFSLLAGATPVDGQTSEADFAACTARLKQEAQAAGISADVSNDVLDNVQWVERVIELDRQQPEFTTTFSDYYRKRVTPARVRKGREMLKEHAELLRSISDRYGVPAHYLVSFWGLETNFGAYLGKMAIPDSLATLACDERRSKFFAAELISAMRIIEAGDASRESMIGSWAGAMGNVQFMPSAFLRYAVDGDGDGRRDLWGSIPDALSSAANFLAMLGWQPGLRWGREVLVPAGFDYAQATRDVRQPLRVWSRAGVTDAFGSRLPEVDLPASILVPGGARGPAFVVYDNFDVIMRWNRSEFYALSVGRLADRIAGAGSLTRPPPEDGLRLSRQTVMTLQVHLNQLGYDTGTPDGIFGSGTRRALREFQSDRNLVADGYPSEQIIAAVAANARGEQNSDSEETSRDLPPIERPVSRNLPR